jgi:hypothetical protein
VASKQYLLTRNIININKTHVFMTAIRLNDEIYDIAKIINKRKPTEETLLMQWNFIIVLLWPGQHV